MQAGALQDSEGPTAAQWGVKSKRTGNARIGLVWASDGVTIRHRYEQSQSIVELVLVAPEVIGC